MMFMNTWKRPHQSFIWVGISFWPNKNSFVWDVDGSQLADAIKASAVFSKIIIFLIDF